MTGAGPTRVIGGRYVVLGELPRGGGAGPVWRAEDRVTGRPVAVAELHLPASQGPDERRQVRERLLRAARAAGRIDHPGVVAVHDVVTDDGVDHIVTELVDAPTLADRVAADGPLGLCTATAVARQLSAALQAAHAADVVHGGVTPRTVVLEPDGRARLADLGVAEAIDPERAARAPEFLAPELSAGGPATPASDLWALGATLHVALHGRPPEPGRDLPGTAGVLDAVLAGLLRSAPQERPTAREVAAALNAAGAPPPDRARRRHWWWAAAGVVLGLLVGLVVGYLLAGAGAPTVTDGAGAGMRLPGPVAAALTGFPAGSGEPG